MKLVVRATLLVSILIMMLPAAPAAAQQDTVTVGTVTGGGVVDVPISIRDASGTPLGIDQPAGSRIQAYSLRVTYSPASAVQSISISRAGITAGLTPTFETKPACSGMIALLDTFSESTNLIPFTSNATLPGNQVANLHVTLNPAAAPGTVITLTLDPVLTQLTNEAGTTAESSGTATLALVNGSITVAAIPVIPTLAEWALGVLALALAVAAVRIRM